MTPVKAVPPDERALQVALGSARFQAGLDAGMWRLICLKWPIGVFTVTAAERDSAPAGYALRIDLSGYPQKAPTATPWDLDRCVPLSPEDRPKGERAGQVFRCNWNEGKALYAPWDRAGLSAHPEWASTHHTSAWHPKRDLAFFLTCVHDLLNDDDYLGI